MRSWGGQTLCSPWSTRWANTLAEHSPQVSERETQDTIGMSLASREELRLASQRIADIAIPGYELKREIGNGSFGSVWEATRLQTGQEVAVKVVRSEHALNWDYFGRELAFLRELEDHPYTLTVLDADLSHEPPFIVTPLVEGGSLEQVGADRERDLKLCSVWIEQLAEALKYIHEKGVIHCDLKPSNILLTASETIRVGDFGQSRRAGQEVAWGTIGFMAPEQCVEDPEGRVNPSVLWDVYGFGATAYWLLTGHRPRITAADREALSTIEQIGGRLAFYRKCLQEHPLVPVRQLNPEVDPDLAQIVESCLKLDPEKRTPSINAVLEDFSRSRKREPLLCLRPWSPGYLVKVAFSRTDVRLMTLLLVLLLWGGYSGWQASRLRQFNFHTDSGLHAQESGRMEEAYLNWLQALKFRPQDRSTLARLSFMPVRQTFPEDDEVKALAFFDEGKSLATASDSGLVHIWSLDGRVLDTLKHEHGPTYVTTSDDSKLLASFSWDGQVFLYDGQIRHRFEHPKDSLNLRPIIEGAVFTHDNRYLVTADGNGALWRWDTETGEGRPLKVSGKAVPQRLAAHPELPLVAAIWDENVARIWDVEKGEPVSPPLAHQREINVVAFSPDGELLATAADDRTVHLWNIEGQPVAALVTDAPNRCLDFSSDGRLAVGSDDGQVKVWNLADLDQSLEEKLSLEHRRPVKSVDFAPEGSWLAVGTGEKEVLWSTSEPNGTVQVWDVDTTSSVAGPWPHDGPVQEVEFTPDGKFLASAAGAARRVSSLYRGTARLWDLRPPEVGTVRPPKRDPAGEIREGNVHLDGSVFSHGENVPILDFAVNRDVGLVATASADRSVRLWSLADGSPVGDPILHDGDAVAVAFGPRGEWLATASHREVFDGPDKGTTVRVWERGSGLPISADLSCPGRLTHLEFSQGATHLTGLTDDHTYRWHLELPSEQSLAEAVEQRLRARLSDSGAVVPR